MPAYLNAAGNKNPSKSIYPGQNALIVGWPAINDGPTAEQVTRLESIATGYKSIPVCVAPVSGGHGYTQRQITWQATYGVEPSAASWILQGSIDDVDDEYQTVDTSSTIGIFSQTVQSNFRFFRILASSVTGACTGAVKITAL
jgi:hypothetical protein